MGKLTQKTLHSQTVTQHLINNSFWFFTRHWKPDVWDMNSNTFHEVMYLGPSRKTDKGVLGQVWDPTGNGEVPYIKGWECVVRWAAGTGFITGATVMAIPAPQVAAHCILCVQWEDRSVGWLLACCLHNVLCAVIIITVSTWWLLSRIPGDTSSDYISCFILLHLSLAKIFLSYVFEMLSMPFILS